MHENAPRWLFEFQLLRIAENLPIKFVFNAKTHNQPWTKRPARIHPETPGRTVNGTFVTFCCCFKKGRGIVFTSIIIQTESFVEKQRRVPVCLFFQNLGRSKKLRKETPCVSRFPSGRDLTLCLAAFQARCQIPDRTASE